MAHFPLSSRPIRRARRLLLTVGATCLLAAAARAELFQALTTAFPSGATSATGALVVTDENHLLTAPLAPVTSGLLLGLARDPTTGDLYAVGSVNRSPTLYRVDFDAGSLAAVGTLPDEIRSLAFDSHGHLFGFVLCGSTFTNELFQIDPTTAVGTPLGSLDSSRLADCSSSLTLGGVIAIDPLDDALYFASNDTNDNLFVDRVDSALVPTVVYQSSGPLVVPTLVPTALTVAGGKLWMAIAGSLLGPGYYYAAFDFGNLGAGPQVFAGAQERSPTGPQGALILGFVESSAACAPGLEATCLYDRFRVEATYDATPNNGSGPATVLLESGQSVKFSFFDPGNVELIVKILDACVPPFNKWWVAGGGLTNVGVQIKVTDTRTGQVRNYISAKNHLFQPFFDTAAFPCP